jgi:hypothetical protein
MSEFLVSLLTTVAEVVLPILSALVAALVAYAMQRLALRFNLRLKLESEAAIRHTVRKVIGAAEEMFARKAKLDPDYKENGVAKSEFAVRTLKALFPKLSEKEIVLLLDEELAEMRAVGATKNRLQE